MEEGSENQDQELQDVQSEEQRKVKAKRNVLLLGIISIVMMFAGFTSAYIVVQRDNFWVSIDMPIEFWISTAVIVVSSITLFIAKQQIQKNYKLTQIFLGLTVVLGITFSVLQWYGWKALIGKGSYLVMPIVNSKGRYAEPYTFYYKNDKIEYDNYEFYMNGAPISDEQKEAMKEIAEAVQQDEEVDLSPWYTEGWALYHKNDLVTNVKGQLYIRDSVISGVQEVRLRYFSDNIINDRGDFYLKGKYGEDFTITYRGQELTYKNRKFYIGDEEMSAAMYDKLSDSQNTASSFLYLFTAMHLLHLIFGLIYLLRLFIITLKKDFNPNINLKLSLGSIYWHFVDGLWIYLYLFLLFIH